MTVAARLVGFRRLLAAVFALAVFAGEQADLGKSEASDTASGEHGGSDSESGSPEAGHGGDKPAEAEGAEHGAPKADPVRGLGVSEDGLTLDLARTTARPGKRFELRFAIKDAKGETVRDFDVEHTKRMHLIIARRDLTGFQHLHPTQAADGSWSVPVKLDDPGNYRVFADFSTDETARTLGADLAVDGKVESRPLPAPTDSVTVDGLKVALTSGDAKAGREAELDFKVTRDGKPVDVEPYLGARGHLVALREGDLAFLHVHPDADRLSFMAEFPSAARYRLFLQFKTEGRMHTAAFTQKVSP